MPVTHLKKSAALFDIAPYALPNCEPGEIRFEEPRDIECVEVAFAGKAPADVELQYLRKVWPAERFENPGDLDLRRPGPFGWMRLDDHFNSEWASASVRLERRGPRTVRILFEPLRREIPEFPGAGNYDVTFRRTLGIRVQCAAVAIRSIRVHTRSRLAASKIRVELDAGRTTPSTRIALSGYNAVVRRVSAQAGVRVRGGAVELQRAKRRAFFVDVRHMSPAHRYSHDDGLLSFDLGRDAFTISLAALYREGPIWFAYAGVYVAQAEDPTTFEDYRQRIAGLKTIGQTVTERPEQSLAGARNGQPRPHPIPFCFGCKHARQKFWLEPNGDLDLNAWLVTRQPGADTLRWKNDGNARFLFGLEAWAAESRANDPWPAVAYNIRLRRDDLRLEQRCFAVPLATSILAGEPAPDATMVVLVRFRFQNSGPAPQRAALAVGYADRAARSVNRRAELSGAARWQTDALVPLSRRDQALTAADGRITSEFGDAPVLRAAYETAMEVSAAGGRVRFECVLAPGEACELVLKIPFVAVDAEDERRALAALSFDRCDAEMRAYWRRECAAGARVRTPDPHLNAVYVAHQPSVKIADLGHPDGSGLVNTSVGTATYGNFTNESCMIVEELIQRGLLDEARRRLGLWVRYQGTVGLTGKFTDKDGVFYGADGLESGIYYCQHHGWALWALCRYYLVTGDAGWFSGVADAVLRGADWIFRQRRTTAGQLPCSRGWETGFLPVGGLEDVGDYFYWLSTNALTWRAADTAARALEAAGHPEAKRVRREADAYRRALRRGFEIARQHSPLIRLRDGTWIPHYPSRLYLRGRDLGWIREVLEGSVYLLLSGLYDARSREGKWILDDFLDTRYMNPPFGYAMEDPETQWYACGGLSVQPNLLAGLLPHLDRDEPEIYLWMFFNAWAACYREEVQAMVEHPLPLLGFSNSAPFKTSDQSNAVKWLVYMFVYEQAGLLHLGRAIPREWMAQEEPVLAERVLTSFGSVSIRYTPRAAADAIEAAVSFEERQSPRRLLVRFRHPAKKAIRAVSVNGRPHKRFDARRGDVDITGMRGEIRIVASYAR